jgi:thiamine-phosphate pyrophosphorylase
MSDDSQPQIYLITPPQFDAEVFAPLLERILDARAIACVRQSAGVTDEDLLARNADRLREICHARDIPLVIETHFRMVERLGLDGCHLNDGARHYRDARKAVGADAIVGCFGGASRHAGIAAGEAGADYVSFGPLSAGALGDGTLAEPALFAWWSEMIEVPVVAEGGLTQDLVEDIAPVADFLAVGMEIWAGDDPLSALNTLLAPLG